jgi:hypothetical protein
VVRVGDGIEVIPGVTYMSGRRDATVVSKGFRSSRVSNQQIQGAGMEDKLVVWRRMVKDRERHNYEIGDYWNALDDACDEIERLQANAWDAAGLIEQLHTRVMDYRAFAQYLIEERGQLLEELRVAEKLLEQAGP